MGSEMCIRDRHNTLLDCFLCEMIMLEARECSRCRKGFCKGCINEYIDTLVSDEYPVVCPSCSSPKIILVDPHPLLMRQLSNIVAQCENREHGCTEKVSYAELERHRDVCPYLRVKCDNYGCEAPQMFQKDFAEHEANCEHRVIRCKKCDIVIIKGGEINHDCVKSMAMKYEHLEMKLIQVSKRLEEAKDQAEEVRLSENRGTQLVRQDIGLPALTQIKFNAELGWQ